MSPGEIEIAKGSEKVVVRVGGSEASPWMFRMTSH